jgi:DNA-binding MarR family transcriptional regulator
MYKNKTAELVNEWAAFEENHPEADIGDFCRYYLVYQREKEGKELFDGALPPRSDIVISKLIDRISKLHMVYIHIAMDGIRINNFEEFALLNAIANLRSPRKTEVIYHTINELSTGLNLLANLRKLGYITEHDDPDDKRSKRLHLTPKGEKVLHECYLRFMRVPEMLFMEMTTQDIEVCVQLLKNVDLKFSALWQQHKGKPFEQVYEAVTGKKAIDKTRGAPGGPDPGRTK